MDKGFCERVGFVPPGRRSHGQSLMHVEDSGGVDAGAEEDKFLFGKMRQECAPRLDWGSRGKTRWRRGIGVRRMGRGEQRRGSRFCRERLGLRKSVGCSEERSRERCEKREDSKRSRIHEESFFADAEKFLSGGSQGIRDGD